MIIAWCSTGGIIIYNKTRIYRSSYSFDNEKYKFNFSYYAHLKYQDIGIPFVLHYAGTKNQLVMTFKCEDDLNVLSGFKIHKINIKCTNEKVKEFLINKGKYYSELTALERSDLGTRKRLKLAVEMDFSDLIKNKFDTIGVTVKGLFLEKDGEESPFNMDIVFKSTEYKGISTFLYELSSY